MSITHFSFFYLYTFLLFLSVSYFVFLRLFYFTKYADYVTRVISNFSTYLVVLYLGAFGLSLAISITFHSASLTSEAFAWYITNQLDLEKFNGTRVKNDCPEPGELIILDKQRIDTMDHSEGKTSTPTAVVKSEKTVDSNDHSTKKQGPHSPIESKRALVSRSSTEFFTSVRQLSSNC